MLGYQAPDSENAYDIFFFRFFFSIRPTDPISGNAFDGKRKKKKRGWPKRYVLEMFKFLIAGKEMFCYINCPIWTKLFQLTQIREKVNTVHRVNT